MSTYKSIVINLLIKGISAIKRQTQGKQYQVFKSTQFLNIQTAIASGMGF